jgi:hypothetical protein
LPVRRMQAHVGGDGTVYASIQAKK